MADQNLIQIILEGIFRDTSLSQGQALVERIQRELARLGTTSEQTEQQTTRAGEEIISILQDVRAAQDLLADADVDQQAAALELLQEEYQRLSQTIASTAQREQQSNNRNLAQIRELQSELAKLRVRRQELEAISNRSTAQDNQLSTVNAQIEGLRNRISALRGTQQAASQTTQQQANSFRGLNDVISLLGERLSNIGGQIPGIGQGLQTIGNGLSGFAAAAGPIAAITAGITALAGAGFFALKKIGELTLGVTELSQQREQLERFANIGKDISAALELAGKSVNATLGDLKDGLAQLKQAQKDALLGNKDLIATLEAVGVTDFTNVEVALEQINTKLKSSGELARGLAVEFSKAFGEEGGRQFSEILLNLDEAKIRAKEFGLIISEDVAAQANKLRNTIADIKAQAEGASNIVGSRFLDAFNELGESINEVLDRLRNDEAFTGSLENTSILIDGIVRNGLPRIVSLLGDVVAFSGKVAGFVSVIQLVGEAIGVFPKFALAIGDVKEKAEGIPEKVKKISDEVKELGRSSLTANEVLQLINNELDRIEKRQSIDLNINSQNLKQQILEVEDLEKRGLLGAIEAQKIKNELTQKDLQDRKEAARKNLDFAQDEALNNIKLEEQRIERAKVVEQKIFLERSRAALDGNKKALEFLDNQLLSTQAKIAASEGIIQQIRSKFGETRLQLVEKLNKTEADLENGKVSAKKAVEDSIVRQRQNTNTAILAEESKLAAGIKERLAQGAIDRQTSENEITEIAIDAQQKRLNSALKALADLQKEGVKDVNLRKQLENDANNEAIKLAQLRLDAQQKLENQSIDRQLKRLETASLERERILSKNVDILRLEGREGEAQFLVIQNLIKGTEDRVNREELLLRKLFNEKATFEDIRLQLEKVKNAEEDARKAKLSGLQQSISAQQKENQQVEALADRHNSIVGLLDKQVGKIQSVNKTFDATTATIDEVRKRIADLRADGEDLLLRSQAVVGGRVDAALSFYDTAEALERNLNERIIKETIETERRRAEERTKLLTETNTQVLEALQDSLEQQEEAQEAHKENLKDLKEDLAEHNKKVNDDIENAEADSQKRIEKIFSDAREKEAKERATEIDRIKAERRQLEIDLRKIDEDARKDKAKREADAIVERAGLNKAVRDAQAELDKAGTQSEKDTASKALAEAQAKLKEFEDKNKGREAAEKTKQEKIKEAEQLLVKEKGEATTEEEIKAAEARFKARKEAAEKAFQDEIDFQEQLAELQKTGTEEEKAALKAKYAEIKKLNDEADVARLKDIDEQLALEKALRAKAEAERQAEIAKQVEEEKKRGQEAIDRLKEQGKKRADEIKQQLKDENKAFAEAEKEREEAIAKTLANLTKNLELASGQISGYIASLAAALGIAADKIKPIADAVAQIQQATKTTQQTAANNANNSSNSTSTSGTSNSSSTGNNPFSSPTGSDPNAGNLGFNRQAANQGNQGNQGNQQNNGSPSSFPASPNNSPASPNNSPSGPSSNTGISASNNQANQNSQVEPVQGNGQIDDSVPDLKTLDEFKAKLLKIQQNLFQATGLDVNKNYKKSETDPIFANLKLLEQSRDVRYKVAIKFINSYIPEIAGFATVNDYARGVAFATIVTREFEGEKGNRTFNYKKSVPEYTKDIDILLAGIERLRKANQPQEPSKFDDDLGTTATPASPGSNSGDINAPKPPNQPSGGRGNNPGPRSPGSSPTPTAKPSNPSGLSDKEKNFFANQEKEKNTGFDEVAESGLKVPGLRPDQAVTPNQPKEPDLDTNPDTAGQAPTQASAPVINNQNQLEFRPQFTINISAKSDNRNSNNNLDINQVMKDLSNAVSDVANAEGQRFMRAINEGVKNYFDKMFS